MSEKNIVIRLESFVCERNPEAFEQFEAAFPAKQKLKQPGQLF